MVVDNPSSWGGSRQRAHPRRDVEVVAASVADDEERFFLQQKSEEALDSLRDTSAHLPDSQGKLSGFSNASASIQGSVDLQEDSTCEAFRLTNFVRRRDHNGSDADAFARLLDQGVEVRCHNGATVADRPSQERVPSVGIPVT